MQLKIMPKKIRLGLLQLLDQNIFKVENTISKFIMILSKIIFRISDKIGTFPGFQTFRTI